MLFNADLEFTNYQREIKLAQRVQTDLLPKQPPCVRGLEVWAAYRPAYCVGGDYHDFISYANENLTFVVADVCGKGLSAAIMMAMVRIVIRTEATRRPDYSPGEILHRSNELLYEDLTNTGTFATIFVGSYDPFTRTLVYANAGHSPVIYCPAGGNAQLSVADGFPVGALPLSSSRNFRLQIRPGDVFIVGTDGLAEAYDPMNLKSAYSRLLREAEDLSGRPASSIAEGLFKAARNRRIDLLPEDDQTLVVIKGV